MVSEKQINDVVDRIIYSIKPKKVILFGSYAYGQPTDDSDVDILVVKEDSDVPVYKRGRKIRKHLRGMNIPMDILVYTEEEVDEWKDVKASLLHQIIEKGKVLYG